MWKHLLTLLLIAAIGGGVYYRYQSHKAIQQRPSAVPSVVAITVTKYPLEDRVEALGTTRANEHIVVTANTSDYITHIHFDDGQWVKKGQVLLTLNAAAQQARLEQAKVNLAQQQREYHRIEDLVRRKTVASYELDRLQSEIDLANAAIADAQSALNDRIIRAPFAGELGLRQVSPGALVSPGTPITTLDDTTLLKLDFQVPERFLAHIKAGDPIVALADAYQQAPFKGKVSSVDPRVDTITRAFTVRAILPNQEHRLKPGMLMRVSVLRNRRQAIVIPEEALLALGEEQYVYLLDKENRVQQQEVTLGLRHKGSVEILSGLEGGEQIITRGKLKVRLGQQVEIQDEDWRGGQP